MQQGKFFFQRDLILRALCNVFQQVGQAAGHAFNARTFLDHRHPTDGIQCIIKEVGVHLTLQQLDLDLAALLVGLLGGLQQVFDAHGHLVDRVPDLPQFSAGLFDLRVIGKIVVRNAVQAVVQQADGLGQVCSKDQCQHQRQQKTAQQGGGNGHPGLCAIVVQTGHLKAGIQRQAAGVQPDGGHFELPVAQHQLGVLCACLRQLPGRGHLLLGQAFRADQHGIVRCKEQLAPLIEGFQHSAEQIQSQLRI